MLAKTALKYIQILVVLKAALDFCKVPLPTQDVWNCVVIYHGPLFSLDLQRQTYFAVKSDYQMKVFCLTFNLIEYYIIYIYTTHANYACYIWDYV